MKKALLFYAALLLSMFSFAQSNTHLIFKSLPIDGNISAFVKKLKSSGMVDHPQANLYTKDVLLKGTFAGMDNCSIKVKATPSSKMVYCVEVKTDFYSDWYSVRSAYDGLVASYRTKYSKCSPFDWVSYPYSDVSGWEIKAVYRDIYSVSTIFWADAGTIEVSIEAESESKAYIKIEYEDKINLAVNKTETQSSVINDI